MSADDTLAAATLLLEHTLSVVFMQPRSKRPCVRPADGRTWWVEDPADVGIVLEQCRREWGDVGLAVAMHPVTSLVVVDVDKGGTPEARRWLRELGVTRTNAWVCRTPRGGYHAHYYWPWPESPTRITDHRGLGVDLLCRGPAIIPPTQGYSWLPGHSPDDIPLADLAEVPSALRDEWLLARGPAAPRQEQSDSQQGWLQTLLSQPIPEGSRNDTLARVAGRLHRKLPDAEAEALLHTVNRSCCQPPLADREIRGIWRSISARAGYTANVRGVDW